jgi:hypothetical protein
MAAKAKVSAEQVVEIREIGFTTMDFYLMGTTPMICNRFAQKAWQELLLPSVKRNRAGLEQSLKHDPLAEFQGSVYRTQLTSPAAFHYPAGAFHKAIAQAAIDLPGAKRAQMERLTKVSNVNVDLFGLPMMFMAMVRNSDISRTPDVRTRAIFPEWACAIQVTFVSSIITQRSIAHLVAAAGALVGIGDWRSERGGNFGAYKCVAHDDPRYLAILEKQGRAAQQAAFSDPAPYDADTTDIYSWFRMEIKRREKEGLLRRADDLELPDVPVHVERGNGADAIYEGTE